MWEKIFIHFRFNCFQVGESWTLPGDKCMTYTCEKQEDQFITVITRKACPAFDPDECEPVGALLPVLTFERAAEADASDRRITVSGENT